MTLETEMDKLKDSDSCSFLGSALALSCYFLVVQEDNEMAEDFLRLADSDALLYQNQVEGGILSESKRKECLDDYVCAIHDLNELKARRTPDGFHKLVELNLKMAKSLYSLSIGKRQTETVNPDTVMLNKRRYLFPFDETMRKECAYPLLLVFLKLIARKNRGKKPFIFEEKEREFLIRLERAVSERTYDCPILIEAGELASSCVPQVKMASLKEDFRYLSEAFCILGNGK